MSVYRLAAVSKAPLVHLLVSRKNPGSTLLEIDLHDTEPRRVPWSMPQVDPWSKFQERAVECLPIEIEAQVLGKVYAEVSLCGDGVVCVLKLLLMDINRHIGAFEVFKASSMIEVQVAHNYCFDVLGLLQLVVRLQGIVIGCRLALISCPVFLI